VGYIALQLPQKPFDLAGTAQYDNASALFKLCNIIKDFRPAPPGEIPDPF
jgi:hypothetical protein